jgi:anti-sigma regulatory factor (Ser/Thr protein kinase)
MNVNSTRPRFAEISTAFPNVPESVAAARRFVSVSLRRFAFSEPAREQAVLLTSEFVANAFATGRPPIRLRVRSVADGVAVVEVTHSTGDDIAADHDEPRDPADTANGAHLKLTQAGRAVVEAFATRWGSRPSGSGVLAWFEISDPPLGG